MAGEVAPLADAPDWHKNAEGWHQDEPARLVAKGAKIEGEIVATAGVLYSMAVHGVLTLASGGQILDEDGSSWSPTGGLSFVVDATNPMRERFYAPGITPDVEIRAAADATFSAWQVESYMNPGSANNHAGIYMNAVGAGASLVQVIVTDNAGAPTGLVLQATNGMQITSKIGFFGTGGQAQQVSGANLTNNVTAGGSNDVITNWTDLVTYANDAAAIRNAVYQLARKVKQLNDGLRTYGLFT